jgi:hypothetical protein
MQMIIYYATFKEIRVVLHFRAGRRASGAAYFFGG